MKRLAILFVLILALQCTTVSAMAGNGVNGVRYRVNITMPAGHDHIYLYDQPSSSNGKNLGRNDNGAYVTGISSVQRKGYTWIYCSYNGKKGYIRKNNLVEVSGGSSSGKSSSGSSGASSGSGNVTFSGNVNVRTGPGLDYGKLGTVNKGQTLTYAGDTRYDNRGVAWYSVYYNGRTGWVSSKYASVNGGSSGKSSFSGNSGSSSNGDAVSLELLDYLGKNLYSSAQKLNFSSTDKYETSDAEGYSLNGAGLESYLGGDKIYRAFLTASNKYTIGGVSLKMRTSPARNKLSQNGWSLTESWYEGDKMDSFDAYYEYDRFVYKKGNISIFISAHGESIEDIYGEYTTW